MTDAEEMGMWLDGQGGARAIDPRADLPTDPAGFAVIWLKLTPGERGARQWLETRPDIDGFVLDALTAEDTRPRCAVHGEGTIVNLRGVNLHPGAEPDDMISIRMWVEARRLIGVWRRPLFAAGDLFDAIDRGHAPVSPGDFIAKLALRLADRMEPTVADLHEQIDAMEDLLDDARSGDPDRAALAQVRRQAITLRRFVAPQRDALTTLTIEELSWMEMRDRSRMHEAGDRTTRVAEELDSVRERAAIVHDQLMEKRAEKMNRYTMLLTVVASIFLPLGLVTGLLGINVGGVPGADTPWAFAAVTALLVTIGGFQLLLYRLFKLI